MALAVARSVAPQGWPRGRLDRDLQSRAANRSHREQQRQFKDPIRRSIAAPVMDQGKTTAPLPAGVLTLKTAGAQLCGAFMPFRGRSRKREIAGSPHAADMMGSVSETKRRDTSYRSTSSNIHRHSRFSGCRGRMAGMTSESEAQAEQRLALLDPVARICERAAIPIARGRFQLTGPAAGSSVAALLCAAADGSWDAMLTVVRAQSVPVGHQTPSRPWRRDPRTGYDLTSDGQLVYELQIHEDDDGAGGHGPRPLVVFQLLDAPEVAADTLIQWWRRPTLYQAPPRIWDPRARHRRATRIAERRRLASAAPRVRFDNVPSLATAHAATIDPAALALHFPRDANGHFLRSAVVALVPLDHASPHLRASWLTVRAKQDELHVGAEDLIGGNQPNRWNLTPWMWHRQHVGALPRERWQLDDAAQAQPYLDALSAGRVTEALKLAGVAVDDQLAKLLRGAPTRNFRAELTETWVANLYAGLSSAAPWRFTAAYAAWMAERGGPARPAAMFGLKGLGQARKPKVALDQTPSGLVLRLWFSGGNLILPIALWTVPADL